MVTKRGESDGCVGAKEGWRREVAACVMGFGLLVELVIRECLVSVFFFLVQGRPFFFIFSLFYDFFPSLSSQSSPSFLHLNFTFIYRR